MQLLEESPKGTLGSVQGGIPGFQNLLKNLIKKKALEEFHLEYMDECLENNVERIPRKEFLVVECIAKFPVVIRPNEF